jgi:hypothetical protein
MADVVYWGNNSTTAGEYTAPKDVGSVAIVQLPGGILVDWGNSTDTLTGTIWQIEPIPSTSAMYFWQFQKRILLDGAVFRDWASDATYSAVAPTFEVQSCNNGGIPQHVLSCRFYSGKYVGGTSIYCGKTYYSPNALLSNAGYFNQFLFQVTASQSFSYEIRNLTSTFVSGTPGGGGYKVTTDTGQTAQRQTDTPPTVSVIPGGCAVAIAYTDNSSEQIPLSECYEWARVRDDKDCPEGTCTVDCADHRCCYDPNTGIAVKVIPL